MGHFDGLPSIIQIGPYDVRLEVREKLNDQDSDFGEYIFGEMRIGLRKEQASSIFAVDTLVHEINHAIYRQYALPHNPRQEEQSCSAFATGWVDVFRKNPWLLDWIKGAINNENVAVLDGGGDYPVNGGGPRPAASQPSAPGCGHP